MLDRTTSRWVAAGAVTAPLLHSVTDLMEVVQGGFTSIQLWLNYAAFLLVPPMVIGLYAVQRPAISRLGLVGAVVYGWAFIYFAHTTLLALHLGVPDYESLWRMLGLTYTAHGAVMVAGGLAFAWASWRANVLPRGAVLLFAVGLLANLVLALVPVPDILQTLGTALRNVGLAWMGAGLVRRHAAARHIA